MTAVLMERPVLCSSEPRCRSFDQARTVGAAVLVERPVLCSSEPRYRSFDQGRAEVAAVLMERARAEDYSLRRVLSCSCSQFHLLVLVLLPENLDWRCLEKLPLQLLVGDEVPTGLATHWPLPPLR